MDIIYLKELKISTIIGVYDWERTTPQWISLDIEMGADITQAAKTDDLQYALDYKAVADKVKAYVEASSFQLIETLAESVANLVMQDFSVPWIRLKVSKAGAIEEVTDLGVIIERGQQG